MRHTCISYVGHAYSYTSMCDKQCDRVTRVFDGFCERCTANVRQVTAKYLSGENDGLSGATPQPKVAEKMPTQL